ncbi:hypothetical protein [Ewingella americana]|nr:hypothetical protein [Ewingella americana]
MRIDKNDMKVKIQYFMNIALAKKHQGFPTSRYIEIPGVRDGAYCKLNPKVMPNLEVKWCFVVSNITVNPTYQNKGIFTAFIESAREVCNDLDFPIYIESVISSEMHSYLKKRKEFEVCSNPGDLDMEGYANYVSLVAKDQPSLVGSPT